MEYLMTYGWAILVIAVVLGALFQLGVFNSASSQQSGCVSSAPYFCGPPSLASNGMLTEQVGQIGSPISVTATGCSTTTSAPALASFSPTSVTLNSGGTTGLIFQCPLTSNTIGTTFSGTLWIQYGTGQIAKVGTINTKATTYGAPTVSTLYIPTECTVSGGGVSVCTIPNAVPEGSGNNFYAIGSSSARGFLSYTWSAYQTATNSISGNVLAAVSNAAVASSTSMGTSSASFEAIGVDVYPMQGTWSGFTQNTVPGNSLTYSFTGSGSIAVLLIGTCYPGTQACYSNSWSVPAVAH